MRQNRSRGVISRSVREKKNPESHRASHRKDMSPLTQGLNYRSACDTGKCMIGGCSAVFSGFRLQTFRPTPMQREWRRRWRRLSNLYSCYFIIFAAYCNIAAFLSNVYLRGKGGRLGQCYIILGESQVLLYNVIWGRGVVKKSTFLCYIICGRPVV